MSAILKEPLLLMRPMSEEDVEEVAQVENAAYPFPWAASIFRDCLRVGYCCWVYALESRVIGYGVMSVAAGESHILNVCIHPEWQGKGLGRRLLRRLMNLAKQHRADTAFLEVRATNRAAISLYESIGFNEVGRRRNYYPAKAGREDALIFACAL